MTREILFRGFHKFENGTETIYLNGKGIKGKWVYGNHVYIKCESKHYIVSFDTNVYSVDTDFEYVIKDLDFIEVIPETIGQYTGLNDKNGKKIFENDVVKLEYQGEDEDTRPIKVGVMNFKETQWCVNSKHLDGFTMRMYTREVIGTIFDDKEVK